MGNSVWRQGPDWKERDAMKTKLTKIEPIGVDNFNIMLHGPIAAGKSSFVDSVKSVFVDHVAVNVLAQAHTDHSCTQTYSGHRIEYKGSALPFVIYDVMGMEDSMASKGMHSDDILNALKGHIREGYEFDPKEPLDATSEWYNAHPSKNEKIHCLVCVVSANNITLQKTVAQKMRDIRQQANKLGIPQIVILTMPDLACPKVASDLKNIFSSTEIKTKVDYCSNELGAPLNCIFPVKNYHSETKLNDAIDVLVLDALIHIVQAAKDYLWSLQHSGKAD
ncbi:interferon-induced protein 44-like [Hypomesus transpacificus]|uniref:interferon-induced protein 44-like n=1 Tax=Hypomesus transpacificus TaxID=137520 RepID=UPI001F075054|nr:interferon-induced protein 44-like [Hypomesus transpacificus]